MTLAYFATYYVVMQLVVRRLAVDPGPSRWRVIAAVSYAVAFT